MKKLFLTCFSIAMCIIIHAQQYKITARLTGFPEHAKFYLKDLAADIIIDSAEITGNRFTMSGEASEPKYYWLYARIEKQFHYTILLIGADKVNVAGNVKDFPFNLKVTGSPSHDVYSINQDAIKQLYTERDNLMQVAIKLLNKPDDSSKAAGNRLILRVKYIDSLNEGTTKRFIDEHLNSYAALSELFGLKRSYSKQELQNRVDKLQPKFRESAFGTRLVNYLKVGDVLKKGDPMFDFEAMDANGKSHRLSSLKGKYILLDFTETYCGPCVLSVQDLKNLAVTYSDRLQIVSFYADGSRKTWMEGVNRDKPTWLTLWDGKGQYGETVMKYGATGYPTFVMIDPSGKIIAHWSGYGKADGGKGSLEEAVDKLMK